MDNNYLVGIVASQTDYLGSTSRCQQVLEALRRVDRKNFIPDDEETLTVISEEAGQELAESLEGMAHGRKLPAFDEIRKIVMGACTINASVQALKVSRRDLAYNDIPLEIGYGQTCSQPSMVAFMADALELKPGMKVLEIGTGCGYHAAVTAELIGNTGKVYSLEYLPELADLAEENLKRHFGSRYQRRVAVIQGDGSGGLPERAPFDAIYLTAGVKLEYFDPGILAQQLKLPGGILLYPEEEGLLVKEIYGHYGNMEDIQFYQKVCFVPLKGKNAEQKAEVPIVRAQ